VKNSAFFGNPITLFSSHLFSFATPYFFGAYYNHPGEKGIGCSDEEIFDN